MSINRINRLESTTRPTASHPSLHLSSPLVSSRLLSSPSLSLPPAPLQLVSHPASPPSPFTLHPSFTLYHSSLTTTVAHQAMQSRKRPSPSSPVSPVCLLPSTVTVPGIDKSNTNPVIPTHPQPWPGPSPISHFPYQVSRPPPPGTFPEFYQPVECNKSLRYIHFPSTLFRHVQLQYQRKKPNKIPPS
jgi:hypothetical protein